MHIEMSHCTLCVQLLCISTGNGETAEDLTQKGRCGGFSKELLCEPRPEGEGGSQVKRKWAKKALGMESALSIPHNIAWDNE